MKRSSSRSARTTPGRKSSNVPTSRSIWSRFSVVSGCRWRRLEGARIAAFSGIASPESFESMLRDFGAEIRYNQRFLDHHRFSRYEIEGLYRKAGQLELDMIVTTEKDAVRLFDDTESAVPLYYLRLEIDILSGEEDFEAAAARICLPRNKQPSINPELSV